MLKKSYCYAFLPGMFMLIVSYSGDARPFYNEINLNLESPDGGSAVGIDSPEAYDALPSVNSVSTVSREYVNLRLPETSVRSRNASDIVIEEYKDEKESNSKSIKKEKSSLDREDDDSRKSETSKKPSFFKRMKSSKSKKGSENEMALKAAEAALFFLNNKITSVNVNGRVLRIDHDCSYFVRAAYWKASDQTMDLFEQAISTGAAPMNLTSGVQFISLLFEKNYRFGKKDFQIGDVIIFNNTWDRNKNRKRDDMYTHVGIVSAVDEDGTIEFIHGNVGRTIKKGYINFDHPDVARLGEKPVNTYLRPKYAWENNSSLNLTSNLVYAFGGMN